MGIEVDYDPIDTTSVLPGAPVQAPDAEGRKLLAMINALDEFIAERTAPGGSSQTFVGHDHAMEGGGPIIRGMVCCMDGGDTAVWTENFVSATSFAQSIRMGVAVSSPGLNPDGRQTYLVAVRYKAISSPWELQFTGGRPVQVEAFDEADKPRWVILEGMIPQGDWLTEQLGLKMTPGKRDDAAAELQIFAVCVWETWEQSQPHRYTTLDPQPLPGNYNVYAWSNQVLDTIMVQAGDWLDAWTYTSIAMRLNALYEFITERAAPGGSTQRIKGHDHHSSGNEGRPVPMGCIYSTWDLSTYLWRVTLTTMNQWYYFDESAAATARRTSSGSSPGGTATTDPMFTAFVTQGFTSSGNPPSTTPYLVAAVRIGEVGITTGKSYEVRIYNVTTGTHSAVTSFTGSGNYGIIVYIDKVPCSGGLPNHFAVEIRCTSHASTDADLTGCAVFEVSEFQGTNRTYISSNGGTLLSVANEFR